MANWQEGDTIIGREIAYEQIANDYPMLQVVEALPNGKFLVADKNGEIIEADSNFLDSALHSYEEVFDNAYVEKRMTGEWD